MFIFVLIITFFLNYSPILASERNIFGLHLTQTQDLESAAKVINSANGDWGYITIVIRTDQLDRQTWQEFFDKCRKLHIIPIVRLATIMDQGSWKKPSTSDIDNLTSFLSSLNWPTTDRHIIFFNEINHGSEWGGQVDIKSFADLSIYTYQKLKTLNPNFFMLSSALDLAAPNQTDQLKTASDSYKEIYLYKPEYFKNIDALASHSYPNHGYIGLPTDSGQHSIRGYIWELNYIQSLGINQTYPIFITETGWPHREGETKTNQYYTADTSANLLIQAFNYWKSDPRIKAITPFIYNYPNPPFDHFSWLDKNEILLPAYQKIVELPKQKNHPTQKTTFEVVTNRLPFIILTETEYLGEIILKNTGESIWGETNFCLPPESTQNVTIDQICTTNNYIYPNQTTRFSYKLKIKNTPEFKDKTFISWKDIPPQEITPLNGTGTIYSPKTTIKQKLIQLVQSWFI